MKTTIRARWILVLGIGLLIPLSSLASGQVKSGSDQNAVKMQKKESSTDMKSNELNEEKRNSQMKLKGGSPVLPANMPIYRPPLRGAPAGRVAGGTRGAGEKFPYLCLLVPEHVGLTAQAQPCLFYFLSSPTNYSMEFTLIERRGVLPLVEAPIRSPERPGVHSICLADFGSHLKPGKQYRWFVALVPDSKNRSKDVLAAGAIEFIDLPQTLKTKLKESDEAKAPYLYAEAGIWYDAVSTLSSLVGKEPGEIGPRKERAYLLEQVGLSRAAQYEIRQCSDKNQ